MEMSKTSGARSALFAVSAALATIVFVIVFAVAPQVAHAGESSYCGGQVLSPKSTCFGAARTFNAEYGTGDQGSVCVGNGVSGAACSSGPGQGVYKPVGQWIYAQPWISNNLLSGNNRVYGTAFTP